MWGPLVSDTSSFLSYSSSSPISFLPCVKSVRAAAAEDATLVLAHCGRGGAAPSLVPARPPQPSLTLPREGRMGAMPARSLFGDSGLRGAPQEPVAQMTEPDPEPAQR